MEDIMDCGILSPGIGEKNFLRLRIGVGPSGSQGFRYPPMFWDDPVVERPEVD